MLTANQILQQGRYRIIATLGQNVAGAEYEAYDNSIEKSVLLKEIPVSLGKVTTAAQMEAHKLAFAAEAKVLTKIKHQTLLQIYHHFSEIDRDYLAVELVAGDDLGEQLKKNKKPFEVMEVADWADQLLDALHYLHTQIPPIIHHDIKPQNLKLNSVGKVKLLAFEIAKTAESKANTTIKSRFFDAASLPYSPLEQIWDDLDAASKKVITNSYDENSEKILEQPADARSDIYALGATLYYLVTAKLPVDALTRSIDILEGKSDPLPTPNEIDEMIPPEISDVLMKAMKIKRENRFSSAVIMRQVLRTAFVRVKERQAAAAKTQPTPKVASAEQKSLAQERQNIEQERVKIDAEHKRLAEQRRIVEQERLKVEAERKRHAEIVEQKRITEAIEQKRLAELLAHKEKTELFEQNWEAELVEEEVRETEKLLVEQNPVVETPEFGKETQESREFLAETLKSDEDFTQIINSVNALSDTREKSVVEKSIVENNVAPKVSFAEPADLFAEPQKDNKLFRRMAAVAAILIVFGGATFGVWSFMNSTSAEPNQAISSSETPAPELKIETTTMQKVEATPETNAIPTPSASPVVTQTSITVPTTKTTKTVMPQATPTPAKKPIVPTKTPAKKAVTVDDLINDN